MREFIRHPASIPIEIQMGIMDDHHTEQLHDISVGGLCFESATDFPQGSLVKIRIPLVDPPFEACGRVAWCRSDKNQYDVGVELLTRDIAYRARMVEQVCYIEQYRNFVLGNEGRRISGQEAALEWISLFASRFPNWVELED